MYRSNIANIAKDQKVFKQTANRTKKINLSGNNVYRGGIRL